MDKTIKFVYTMILFISMFLAARNVDGRIFFLFKFLSLVLFSLYIIFYLILVTLLHSLFFMTAYLKCKTVDDCPKSQVVYKCVGNYCRSVRIRRRILEVLA